MKREELKVLTDGYAMIYNKDDADSVMDAMEQRIKELEDSYKYFKAQNKFHIEQSNELAESCRDKNKLIETLLQRIDELEATQPKWISVEDEMPNDEALLLHENGLINVGGYVEEDKIWIGFGHVQLNDVHHWMPLPQRHKSED